MSAALAAAGRLKPEVRLAQAVSLFEADLSGQQKASFRTYKAQALNSPPTTTDVMHLTAELDRKVSEKARSLRCFGPRLTNVLQAVQQFAALGDIIIGGSQNLVACGVWALVRMTLLLMVNFSSYLEKLSLLLMTVGRSAPRYQNMALLYPRSKDLQSCLSEYFIVIVRLCHQMLKFTQRSILGQLASSLSDADLKAYQSDLDSWANSIKEEITLLLGTSIEDERRENSLFRSLLKSSSHSESLRRKLERKQRILDACSQYNYETTWKQARKNGHATLFNEFPHYQKWKASSTSSTLICKGKLGSGKSVLLSNIVDDISLHTHDEKSPAAYFFCRHDIAESLRANTIVGALARQLLEPQLNLDVEDDLKEVPTPDLDEIVGLVNRVLPTDSTSYVVLDGIDECDTIEVETVIKHLRYIQNEHSLLLCISVRPEAHDILESRFSLFLDPHTVVIPDNNPDIERFITGELERVIDTEKLAVGDPALVLEIREALIIGAQGMFLWVALQIEALCAEKTDEAIRLALADLPKNLSETFERILRKSEKTGKEYQIRVFELVVAARRPLTVAELREALSVEPGDTMWNPSRIINDIYSILASCGSLVTIDEEELTVRFVHHSVRQYILSSFADSTGGKCTERSANGTMASIIITYLNYGVFDRKVSTLLVPTIRVGATPSKIIGSTLGARPQSTTKNLALKLLRSARQPNNDIGKTLADASGQFKPRQTEDFLFYGYAESCWKYHVGYLADSAQELYRLLRKLLDAELIDAEASDRDGRNPLSHVAEQGNPIVAAMLLEKCPEGRGSVDDRYRTLVWHAAAHGHQATLKILLKGLEDLVFEPTPLPVVPSMHPYADSSLPYRSRLLLPRPLQGDQTPFAAKVILDIGHPLRYRSHDESAIPRPFEIPKHVTFQERDIQMAYAVENGEQGLEGVQGVVSLHDILCGDYAASLSRYHRAHTALCLSTEFWELASRGRAFPLWDTDRVMLRKVGTGEPVLDEGRTDQLYLAIDLFPRLEDQPPLSYGDIMSLGRLINSLTSSHENYKTWDWFLQFGVEHNLRDPLPPWEEWPNGYVMNVVEVLERYLDHLSNDPASKTAEAEPEHEKDEKIRSYQIPRRR